MKNTMKVFDKDGKHQAGYRELVSELEENIN